MEVITSAQNPRIKDLLALQEKSRLRREKGLFVVEGHREVSRCRNAGFKLRTLFICREILGKEAAVLTEKAEAEGCPVCEVSPRVYSRIAYRSGTEGIIAEAEAKGGRLEDLVITRPDPLIAVIESVEKPGNIGAVLRSADAAGADALIICDPLTDLYNPNLIRASLGAAFTVQTAAAGSSEAIEWVKGAGLTVYTAQLQDSLPYYDADMTRGTAIVLGTESAGLSDMWRKAADRHIRIPMLGKVDSLNVSVSAAILLYEAVRQRNSNG